jgi:hypothetical protein
MSSIGPFSQTVHTIADIENVQRPCSVALDGPPSVVKDLLWSDPTSHDSVEGFTSSKRGPGVSAFGPDQVRKVPTVESSPWSTSLEVTRLIVFGFQVGRFGFSMSSFFRPGRMSLGD